MGAMTSVRLICAALLTSMGCSVTGSIDLPQASSTAPEKGVATAAVAPGDDGAITDWREAARLFQWDRALELLGTMDPTLRNSARMRLAVGWIALQAGKYAEAVQALDGLEAMLPMAEEEILAFYAKAAAHAGPYDRAAKLLEASPKVEDLILAARAWERGGDLVRARQTADLAVERAERVRKKDLEAEAHLARAAIAEAKKDTSVAASDYRWLVVEQPEHPRVREAIEGVDRLGAALSLDVRLLAIGRSSSPLNLDASLALLDSLATTHQGQTQAFLLARARVLFSARDYPRARDAYDQVAAQNPAYASEAQYYAARAAARMGDEEGALKRYALAQAGGWGDKAAYRRAELLLTVGRYDEAATAFAGFASRSGKNTEEATDARYGQALAWLSGGAPEKAGKLLSAMRDKESDPREQANLQELEGVAALRAGKPDFAKRLWLEVVRKQPLTWAALAAHARLRATGYTPLPPLMADSGAAGYSALPVALPTAPMLFYELGMDPIAEQRLASMEQEMAMSYPSRESEALCEMYGMLSGQRRRYQVGSRAVSLEQLMRTPNASERWAWNCVYPQPFPKIVRAEEERHGVPRWLVHAVMRQESAFATSAVSPVGARGLMQLMPNTAVRAAKEIAFDVELDQVTRPDVNVKLGTYYLGKLLKGFKGNVALTAAGYNAGPDAAQRWLETSGDRDTDLWVARIPYAETRVYVQRVLANYARYQWLDGGSAAVSELELTLPTDTTIVGDTY
jgi:soluble lytic murein transglycosylase